MNNSLSKISCIILAGGEGKRVGGQDKGLVLYKSKPLIEYVINVVKHQVDDIVISANRNLDSYKKYSDAVISDASEYYRGPLAGIAASLPHCKHQQVLVFACDMPCLTANVIERLVNSSTPDSVSIASVDNHHQLAMVLDKSHFASIQQQLDNGQLKLISWVRSVPYVTINFNENPEAFVNLNQLTDIGQNKEN